MGMRMVRSMAQAWDEQQASAVLLEQGAQEEGSKQNSWVQRGKTEETRA